MRMGLEVLGQVRYGYRVLDFVLEVMPAEVSEETNFCVATEGWTLAW